jgi:hypothetical protein
VRGKQEPGEHETINAELHRLAQDGALALVELDRNSERNALFVIGDSVAARQSLFLRLTDPGSAARSATRC